MPAELYGPFGALVILGIVVTGLAKMVQALWKSHQGADQRERDLTDKAEAIAKAAVDGLDRMAIAWETRNREDAARTRKTDR